ncbi:uncharacterized protein LOC108179657 isoform a precursor [Danio rerio]|uniref:Uncharacterized protein LOC108179657 isoform a precursor n=2 Tax=Danio rerio TaxID=7955 RepID=A0AB13A8R0_DANRE|nr:uncharacterized protein LOC108179657 isoform a precursor [Danio rerio]|eukprot:XP_017207063.1 uncharacterized protein LOC108179657 isoform X1 [Danio rerio]
MSCLFIPLRLASLLCCIVVSTSLSFLSDYVPVFRTVFHRGVQMRYTFKPDDCMVISIPLGSIRNMRDGQLMPEKFTCVFKDAYKVFLKGRPKELGAAQLSIGAFIICIGSLLSLDYSTVHLIYTLPSVLFIATGVMTFASGSSPFMPVVKLSFIFNIISLFWSITLLVLCPLLSAETSFDSSPDETRKLPMFIGLKAVIGVLGGLELILALVLIYWESKAVCRPHFNTLPLITIKQDM